MQITLSTAPASESWGKNAILSFNQDQAVIHHLSLAYQFCDEIILLEQGKLLAVGETKAVLNSENLAKAFHIRAEIDPLEKTISKIEKQ